MKSTVVKFVNGLGKEVPMIRYDQNSMIYGKEDYALVLFLHGRGEYGDGTENGLKVLLNSGNHGNILRAADERKNFLVLVPQFVQAYNYGIKDGKTYQTWQPDWNGGYYVNDIIDWAIGNMPIDPKRIYLTGLSSGGSGTWDYILRKQEYCDRIAAAIPVCPGIPEGNFALPVLSNLPIWSFHAENDPANPVVGTKNATNQLNAARINPTAKMTIYPTGGHGIWGTAYGTKELYDWMLSQINDVIPTSSTTTSTTTQANRTVVRIIIEYSDGTKETKP